MKPNLRVLAILAAIVLLSLSNQSCSKEDTSPQNTSQNSQTDLSKRQSGNGSVVKIVCQNSCDDGSGNCIMNGVGKVVSCSCSGCSMIVTVSDRSGTTSETEAVDLAYTLDYLGFFQEHLNRSRIDSYELKEVHIDSDNDQVSELYIYRLPDGTEESILYAGRLTGGGKVYEIDCTGSCGCREQINLETSVASCSCSECVMTVTER